MANLDEESNQRVLIRSDNEDGITVLKLNRPKNFNALSMDLMTILQAELDLIANDKNIRVVILAGSGKAFCAGHDLNEIIGDTREKKVRNLFEQCSRLMLTLIRMPQPIIAKVHGIATAAGCQLVTQCDLAIASSNTMFGTSGIGIGLFCGTPSVPLARNAPRKQALEMLLTGEFIDAHKAEKYGLINKVTSLSMLDQEVEHLAQQLTKKDPTAISMGKQLFYSQIEESIENGYKRATNFMVENIQIQSTQDGLKAFLAKKDMPEWPNR